MEILGIDIGGSGIKGARVDIEAGTLATERYRLPTPEPSKPEPVADIVAEIVQHFAWEGAIGITFPAVVRRGVTYSAANVDQDWIGTDARTLFERKTNRPVVVVNDADAAGVAEMAFGAGRGKDGVVMMLTLGTGIGSAIFIDGILVPNTELGHLQIRGKDAEHRAADSIRQRDELSWKKWARRLNEVLAVYEKLFSPDMFIIGGGVSKKHEKFLPLLQTQAEIVPAQLQNQAGIIGAAFFAKKRLGLS
jgi:polyphosphate glucokinase